MKILVIQQKRIGDVLASSIICNNLRIKYPDSIIHFMCYQNCSDVLTGNPNINSIIILEDDIRKSLPSLLKFCLKIKASKYDILIDVYGKLETNLITLFSGSKCKISYYKWYSKIFYNHNIHRLKSETKTTYGQAIDNRLLLLKPLKPDNTLINPYPKLYISENENINIMAEFDRHNISKSRKIVMISLLGSENSKTYPLEYMAKTIDYIANHKDVSILFNYFPSQIENAKHVYELCSKNTQKKIHFDLLAPDLKSFIALMNQCDVILGNDGGAINMAKALNKPSFTIFSPHVLKNDWATFEDSTQNISVHLNDFKHELIDNQSNKEIKKNGTDLYLKFNPELFIDKIYYFLNLHL